jgi:3-hydroxybutyryl-CoA dehydrogenase
MSVSTIGVIGAGVMGSGIAQVAATKGINVVLLDVNEKAVKTGIDAVESRLSRVVAKGKMAADEKEAAVRRIKGTTAYETLKPADVIIEAATEDYGLKTRIFKQVDSVVSAQSIVCCLQHLVCIHHEACIRDIASGAIPGLALLQSRTCHVAGRDRARTGDQ